MQLFHTSSSAQKSLRKEMYLCIYTPIYDIRVYVYVYIYVHLYIEKRMSVCISIHAHLRYAVVSHFEQRATVALVNLPRSARIHAYVYIYTYICIHVYLYVYIYTPSVCNGLTLRAARKSRSGETSDVRIYAYVHFYIPMYVYICMYKYICIRTFCMQLFHTSSREYKSLRKEIYICIYTHPYMI